MPFQPTWPLETLSLTIPRVKIKTTKVLIKAAIQASFLFLLYKSNQQCSLLIICYWIKRQQYHQAIPMGGAPHEPVKFSKQPLQNSHPYLEQGWVVRQEKRSYVQKSTQIQEKKYEEWRAKVSKVLGYPNHQFSFLPLDMGYIENQTCSKHGYTLVNYPDFPYILSDQIRKRQDLKLFFKEKELFYLLYALVAVKVDALQRKESVGDIKPENVFINNEQKVKIGILHSFPYESTNFSKAKDPQGKSKNILLAPEDLKLASQNQLDNSDNPKSEVFSIGATVLSAGLLQDLSGLYDYSNWTFSTEKFAAITIAWLEQEQYSQIFKSIVLNLVSPQPEKRIGVEELWKFLSKYQSFIIAKEKFIVVNPPECLEQGVSLIRSKVHN